MLAAVATAYNQLSKTAVKLIACEHGSPPQYGISQANRMADALIIADLAGRDELTRVQQLYMKKLPSPYMRVVKAIQGNDFVSECP